MSSSLLFCTFIIVVIINKTKRQSFQNTEYHCFVVVFFQIYKLLLFMSNAWVLMECYNKKTKGTSILYYYMANPVLGESLCSDWFFLGQDFAVRTVSMETVQSVYFCFGAKPANSKFATKIAKKNCEYCHSSQ